MPIPADLAATWIAGCMLIAFLVGFTGKRDAALEKTPD